LTRLSTVLVFSVAFIAQVYIGNDSSPEQEAQPPEEPLPSYEEAEATGRTPNIDTLPTLSRAREDIHIALDEGLKDLEPKMPYRRHEDDDSSSGSESD